MWYYLYFLILIKVKDKTEFTGPESFVYSCIQVSLHIHPHHSVKQFIVFFNLEKKSRLVSTHASHVT